MLETIGTSMLWGIGLAMGVAIAWGIALAAIFVVAFILIAIGSMLGMKKKSWK